MPQRKQTIRNVAIMQSIPCCVSSPSLPASGRAQLSRRYDELLPNRNVCVACESDILSPVDLCWPCRLSSFYGSHQLGGLSQSCSQCRDRGSLQVRSPPVCLWSSS